MKLAFFLASGLVLLSVSLASPLTAAQDIATNPPPLLPGEYFALTRNGCAIIALAGLNDGGDKAKFINELSKEDWSGQCRQGLVHGWGTLSRHLNPALAVGTGETYFLGRSLQIQSSPSLFGSGLDITYFDKKAGQVAQVKDRKDPFDPVWSASPNGRTSIIDPAEMIIWSTQQSSCRIEADRFTDCSIDRAYQVFGVQQLGGKVIQTHWCPNPKSSDGCEGLWKEKTAGAVQRINELVARVKQQDAEDRASQSALMEPWLRAKAEAQMAAALTAVRKDAEATAQRDVARVAADSKNAAARDKAESAFTSSLDKMNAGQLFALADAKRLEGDPDKARQAFRVLLSRFPDHALAGPAAQQLTALPAAPAAVASTTPAGGVSPMEALAGAMGARTGAP